MGTLLVGPFNRVEGDLEVTLEISDGLVREARVNAPLFRGFEQILRGKDPRDALVFTPRLCGICSVSQSMAAAYALADAQCVDMPSNGELATNLMLAAENLADHFTHFYLFFMPDFARQVYADQPWFASTSQRFRALSGSVAREASNARAEFLHLMGLLAGKWPHTLSLQPGGSARPIETKEKVRLLAVLGSFRSFLESHTFGDRLEHVTALAGADALNAWAEARASEHSDLALFLRIAESLDLHTLGRASDRFMSYGNYPIAGQRLFRQGLWERDRQLLDPAEITEDVSHSWMQGMGQPLHPWDGLTRTDPSREGAYSWCKAPRLAGRVVEVGALARQVVDGHPLILDLVNQSGGNVRNRVVARLLEIARVIPAMEDWVRRLKPRESFCNESTLPADGEGVGLLEAARGSLGHWLRIRNGVIENYQIVAPTTWNFSPRDREGVPGALEQALVGAPVRPGEKTPVSVQHIVRSFDPCMVCTVH